ncbi:hypothetical protein ACLBYG_21015 [Methylobacterium sp. D53M]
MGADRNRPLAVFAGAVALAALGTGLTVRGRAQRARESESRFGKALSEMRGFLVSASLVDLDTEPAASAGKAGASHLRDMGATLVDKARARLLEAQADKLERETAAEFAYALGSDRPFQADRWSVISDFVPGTIIACARDLHGREIRIETSPDRARWLAEHLLAAARQVDLNSEADGAMAVAVCRHSEGA